MLYRSLLSVTAALVVVFAVGCAAPAVGAPGNVTAAPSVTESPVATPDTGASPIATPAAGSTRGLAPDVATRAVEWLAKEVNVSAEDLRLVGAERVDWTDSCLGLGGPAESCLQAITPGWRIKFEAGDQQYELRTDEVGSVFRLAPPAS